MLSRKYRFHGLGSVRPAMRHGVVVRDPLFTIKALKNPKRVESRAAVIVSRKVAAKAVERNRIRRRLFEIMRLNWQLLVKPTDIVLIVHDAKVGDLTPTELEDRLLKSLKMMIQKLEGGSINTP